jgi:hypothetical protein
MKIELTDEQIDAFFGPSPFIARRRMDKSCYEVVEQTNEDWRECMRSVVSHGNYATAEEADIIARRLHVRWVLSNTESLY